MIDPTTGWFEMAPIEEKTAINIVNQVEITWFSRYPWPMQLICNHGTTEFMRKFITIWSKMIMDWNATVQPRAIHVQIVF